MEQRADEIRDVVFEWFMIGSDTPGNRRAVVYTRKDIGDISTFLRGLSRIPGVMQASGNAGCAGGRFYFFRNLAFSVGEVEQNVAAYVRDYTGR